MRKRRVKAVWSAWWRRACKMAITVTGGHTGFCRDPPMGRSYAREIASKYGISYEQLATLLQQRGVLDDSS